MLFFQIFKLPASIPNITPEGCFALDPGEEIQKMDMLRSLDAFEKKFLLTTGYSPGEYPAILVVLHPMNDRAWSDSKIKVDSLDGWLLKIQIDLIGARLDTPEARILLTKAMLLREYYGSIVPPAGSKIHEYPSWILHGLALMCSPQYESYVIPSQFFSGNSPPTIKSFLLQSPPENRNYTLITLYQAMSASLLQAAIKSPHDTWILRSWLGHFNLSKPQREMEDWPEAWNMRSIEKRWLLIMANSSGSEHEVWILTYPVSFMKYDALIQETPIQGHSLSFLKCQKGKEFIIRNLSSKISLLLLQSNPLVIPLLRQTLSFLDLIKNLPLIKLQQKERELAAERVAIFRRCQKIKDYMDWYEAAKLPVRCRMFEPLLDERSSPLKKGPIGSYLDIIEERGW